MTIASKILEKWRSDFENLYLMVWTESITAQGSVAFGEKEYIYPTVKL